MGFGIGRLSLSGCEAQVVGTSRSHLAEICWSLNFLVACWVEDSSVVDNHRGLRWVSVVWSRVYCASKSSVNAVSWHLESEHTPARVAHSSLAAQRQVHRSVQVP